MTTLNINFDVEKYGCPWLECEYSTCEAQPGRNSGQCSEQTCAVLYWIKTILIDTKQKQDDDN